MSCYLCCNPINGENVNSEDDRLFCCDLHASYYKPLGNKQNLPWTIASDPQFGRYLVASRDIGPGNSHHQYIPRIYDSFYKKKVASKIITLKISAVEEIVKNLSNSIQVEDAGISMKGIKDGSE